MATHTCKRFMAVGQMVILASIFFIAGCDQSTLLTSAPDTPNAGIESASAAKSGAIPGRFIVTLGDQADPRAVAREHGLNPDFVYSHALNGFAGATSDAARDGLLRDARVVRVEPDGVVHAITTSGSQAGATWGIDRIDQRSGVDGTYTWDYNGTGVQAYIIDTGIRITHEEFGTRASHGFDSFGGNGDDCNGHGTHVAGTTGGNAYGVAKNVALIGVRVLDCGGSGTWSGVIAGVDYVTGQKNDNPTVPMVANMSLGGGANSSVDDAVNRMIDAGVATAVAAGNGNMGGVAQDACKYSPARVPNAMTIGATDDTDTKTSWSNYGSCVDWFAPGRSITSAWIDSNTSTKTISGTSMASPHTAGVAALYLSHFSGATPADVSAKLLEFSTKGIVKQSKTTNNHLLFSKEVADTGSGDGGGGGGTCRGNKCS